MAKNKKKEPRVKGEDRLLNSPLFLDDIVTEVGKKLDMLPVNLQRGNLVRDALSTGSLAIDLITGGGYLPGSWVTIRGETGCGKSTFAYFSIKNSVKWSVPVFFLDYEGSTSPNYLERIMGYPLNKIMGVKDEKGKFIVEPLMRYYQPTIGENAFRFVHRILKQIPDKIEREGKWYLVYPKEWGKDLEGKYKCFKENGNFFVETTHGGPQAIIFIDSLAAMFPEARDENDESSPMAKMARMFSESIPMVKTKLASKRVTIVATNQMRLKPMCVHHNTSILMSDGTQKKIGDLVLSKSKESVMSYNFEKKIFEPKPIVKWMINGQAKKASDFKLFTSQSTNSNGRSYFTVTDNHKIFVDNKGNQKYAKDLKVGDYILNKLDNQPTLDSLQLIYGSILGDGFLSDIRRSNSLSNYKLKIAHGFKQEQYCRDKAKILGSTVFFDRHNSGFPTFLHEVKGCAILDRIYRESYDYDYAKKMGLQYVKRRFSDTLAKNVNLKGIAIWYMDDGQISPDGLYFCGMSVASYEDSDVEKFKLMLTEKTKLKWNSKIKSRGYSGGKERWTKLVYLDNKEDIYNFLSMISPYMTSDCLAYKTGSLFNRLPLFNTYIWKGGSISKAVRTKILSKEIADEPKGKFKNFYDLEIADNHNFIANGAILHNSMFSDPRYEPGGQALAFYPDLVIDMRPISVSTAGEKGKGKFQEEATWDGKGIDRYKFSKIFIEKNKKFSPFRTSYLRIWFEHKGQSGSGIDPFYDCLAYLRATGQVIEGRKFKIKVPGPWTERDWEYQEFKELILNPNKYEVFKKYGFKDNDVAEYVEKIKKAKTDVLKEKLIKKAKNLCRRKLNLIEACYAQIYDSSAFKLYFDTLASESKLKDVESKKAASDDFDD